MISAMLKSRQGQCSLCHRAHTSHYLSYFVVLGETFAVNNQKKMSKNSSTLYHKQEYKKRDLNVTQTQYVYLETTQ